MTYIYDIQNNIYLNNIRISTVKIKTSWKDYENIFRPFITEHKHV